MPAMRNIFQRVFAGLQRALNAPWHYIALQMWDGEAGGGRWNFTDYCQHGYKRNWVVSAVLNIKTTALAAIPLCIKHDGKPLEDSDIPPALAALAKLLKQPMPGVSYTEWATRGYLHLHLAGEWYSHIVGVGRDVIHLPSGSVIERTKSAPMLAILRPDYIEPHVNEYGVLTSYRYSAKSGVREIPAEDVMVVRWVDPEHEHTGLSPLLALEPIIRANNAGHKWNERLYRNSARPSGIYEVNGMMSGSPEDKKAAAREWGKEYEGPLNAGATVFLPGNQGKFTPLSMTPREVDWLGGDGMQTRAIAEGLGVPSMLIGDPAAKTYANYSEARKAFYTETILPDVELLCDKLNLSVVSRYDSSGRYSIGYSTAHIDCLQEDMTERMRRVNMAKGFITVDEARIAAGYEPWNDEFGEEIYGSSNNPLEQDAVNGKP